MLWCSITDMLGETVTREFFIISAHPAIARDLGDDRSGGNRNRLRIATNNRALRQAEVTERHRINQQIVWRGRKRSNGRAHGFFGRLQNIEAVNLCGLNAGDGVSAS